MSEDLEKEYTLHKLYSLESWPTPNWLRLVQEKQESFGNRKSCSDISRLK